MAQNQYITVTQYQGLLADLDYAECDDAKQQDLLDRATADLEADLSKKYTVPLTPFLGDTYLAMQGDPSRRWATNKVLNAIKSKLREIIGYDKNRNLTGVIESTQKFINVHSLEYKEQIKVLLDNDIVFGFVIQSYANDSQSPVQSLGLARSDNDVDPFDTGSSGTSGYGFGGGY